MLRNKKRFFCTLDSFCLIASQIRNYTFRKSLTMPFKNLKQKKKKNTKQNKTKQKMHRMTK